MKGYHVWQGRQERMGVCMAWVPPCTCTIPMQTPRCPLLTWATGKITASCLGAPAATQHLAFLQPCHVSHSISWPCSHGCPLKLVIDAAMCDNLYAQVLMPAAGEGGHRSAALAMMHPDQQMHQEFLCNGLGLPGMPQQPMQSHLQYQHATLDPSLAANMAHLGLGQCSVMDNLQSATWQVRVFCLD